MLLLLAINCVVGGGARQLDQLLPGDFDGLFLQVCVFDDGDDAYLASIVGVARIVASVLVVVGVGSGPRPRHQGNKRRDRAGRGGRLEGIGVNKGMQTGFVAPVRFAAGIRRRSWNVNNGSIVVVVVA